MSVFQEMLLWMVRQKDCFADYACGWAVVQLDIGWKREAVTSARKLASRL